MLRWLLVTPALFVSLFVSLLVACDGSGPPEGCLEEGVVPRESCEDFCDLGRVCDVEGTSFTTECEDQCECQHLGAERVSDACGQAWDAEFACVGALDCEGFAEFLLQTNDAPCQEESAATEAECFDENGLPLPPAPPDDDN